jgi:prepilin-type N-terminal cleavage/methylation domain-containing protein
MLFNIHLKKTGFTLVETIVGIAVFLIIATASYQAYISLFNLINLNQYKIAALNLANEQFEIIRNLPYADVGISGGIPNGKLSHTQNLTRNSINFLVTLTVRNIDLPFDGTIGGSPNDLSPADNKTVEVQIDCSACKNFTPITLTTTIAPKNLETASTNGSLLIRVFDSNGVAIPDASVHIVNSNVTPNIVIDDVTGNDGILQIVDAPPGTNAYQITVTKSGYSTDRTYTPGVSGNTTPTKPDATVILQQVTPISFAIDKISTLSFSSVTPLCVPVGGIDFSLAGSKTIGSNILKYLTNLVTNESGSLSLSSMEWDSYNLVNLDSTYDIIGLNPLNLIILNPDTNQNVSVIVAEKNEKSLLVTVKDSATMLPLTDAVVNVTSGGSYDQTKTTGRGFINQTDWSQVNSYTADDGNIDTSSPAGEIKLKNVFGNYNLNSWLESLTIDTGSASNFYNLTWSPINQPVGSSVKFQFATNSTTTATTTWDYKGPDGTVGTFYTSPNSTLSVVHNGDRYARFKVFLDSNSTSITPNISDISFTVTSLCTPPGQVVFSGLLSGMYTINVTKSGYSNNSVDASISSSWKEQEIILTP